MAAVFRDAVIKDLPIGVFRRSGGHFSFFLKKRFRYAIFHFHTTAITYLILPDYRAIASGDRRRCKDYHKDKPMVMSVRFSVMIAVQVKLKSQDNVRS